MNKYVSITLLFLCAILSSCNKMTPSLFGTIPSIYENRIFKIAQKAHALNQEQGIGAGTDIILAEVPLAYDSANVEALPQADKLVGCEVASSIDEELGYTFASKVKISEVTLPTFSPSHAEPASVTLEFDLENATDVARIYYFLCSEQDTIACGLSDVLPVDEGKLHASVEIKAPNIPAEYQEKISVFRIVSEHSYGYKKLFIDQDQKAWRAKYNERLNGRKSSLPLK